MMKDCVTFFGASLQSAVLTIISSSRAVKQFCLSHSQKTQKVGDHCQGGDDYFIKFFTLQWRKESENKGLLLEGQVFHK